MRTRRWHGLVALLCAGTMVLAACGGDDDGGDPTTTTGPSTTTTAADGTTTTTLKPVEALLLTADAYGPIKIGMTQAEVKATGLLKGDFETGCELGGPGEEVATLAPPLDGTVTTHDGKVEKLYVRSQFVTSPGKVKAGDDLPTVQGAFTAPYEAMVDKSSEDTFGVWWVDITKDGQHQLQIWVDPQTQKVVGAGAPYVPTCE